MIAFLNSTFDNRHSSFLAIHSPKPVYIRQHLGNGPIELSRNILTEFNHFIQGMGQRFIFNNGNLIFFGDFPDSPRYITGAFCQHQGGDHFLRINEVDFYLEG